MSQTASAGCVPEFAAWDSARLSSYTLIRSKAVQSKKNTSHLCQYLPQKISKLHHWILSRSMTVFCQSAAKFGHCAAHPPERVDICIRTSNRRWNNFQGKLVL